MLQTVVTHMVNMRGISGIQEYLEVQLDRYLQIKNQTTSIPSSESTYLRIFFIKRSTTRVFVWHDKNDGQVIKAKQKLEKDGEIKQQESGTCKGAPPKLRYQSMRLT